MRILHTEWSDGWGGQERRILLEARGLIERGHTVMLATRPSCWIAGEAARLGIPVHTMPMRGKFDFRAALELARLIKRAKIDLLHTHSGIDAWIGAFAGKLAGVPVVRTRHLYLPLKRRWFNLVHYLTDCVFSLGETMRRMLIDECGFPPERVISIPTGIDFKTFTPTKTASAVRAELDIPEAAFLVLKVGVIRGVKRHEVAIRAFARLLPELPNAYLVLAGEGPMRQDMEALVETLGIQERVRFLGHRIDVPDLMNAADVLLLTSRSEAQSQALTQGIGLGLPVVATNVGGVPEVIIHEKTGLLVAPEDPEATAAALLRIARVPGLAAQLGAAAKAHALANYSLEAMLVRTERAYTALLESKRPRT